MCKHKRSKKVRRTLPWLEKRVTNRQIGQQIICRKTMLGTSALHMAVSPTENNTVRTRNIRSRLIQLGNLEAFP